jgi:carbamoyltransferase
VPVLLNTSLNVSGEPIACTPEDALRTFLASGLDHLALGDFLVSKGARPARRVA